MRIYACHRPSRFRFSRHSLGKLSLTDTLLSLTRPSHLQSLSSSDEQARTFFPVSSPSLRYFLFCRSYKYNVKMPWYARLVLGKSILWHDLVEIDQSSQVIGRCSDRSLVRIVFQWPPQIRTSNDSLPTTTGSSDHVAVGSCVPRCCFFFRVCLHAQTCYRSTKSRPYCFPAMCHTFDTMLRTVPQILASSLMQ